ncbi:MAG: hypothetical protein AAFX99_26325, partial [Myxococcota bacterium]
MSTVPSNIRRRTFHQLMSWLARERRTTAATIPVLCLLAERRDASTLAEMLEVPWIDAWSTQHLLSCLADMGTRLAPNQVSAVLETMKATPPSRWGLCSIHDLHMRSRSLGRWISCRL